MDFYFCPKSDFLKFLSKAKRAFGCLKFKGKFDILKYKFSRKESGV